MVVSFLVQFPLLLDTIGLAASAVAIGCNEGRIVSNESDQAMEGTELSGCHHDKIGGSTVEEYCRIIW
jgi:hypothetical protein